MSAPSGGGPTTVGFPRFFKIAGYWVNSYKFFLCVGIYAGTLATAALANSSGYSPLRLGLGAMTCALVGLIGARVYHLLVHAPSYLFHRCVTALWNTKHGGASGFGALLTFVPAFFAAAAWLDVPPPILGDHMAVGVLTAGFWIRLGCVFNGCCGGRPSRAPLSVTLHDTHGVKKLRLPVQFLEMAWWLAGLAAFLMLWPAALPPGSYALAVLAWYGVRTISSRTTSRTSGDRVRSTAHQPSRGGAASTGSRRRADYPGLG